MKNLRSDGNADARRSKAGPVDLKWPQPSGLYLPDTRRAIKAGVCEPAPEDIMEELIWDTIPKAISFSSGVFFRFISRV